MTRATFGLALTIGAAALAAPQTPQPSNIPALPDSIPTSGTIHSVILLAGSKAGDEVVWKTPDGTMHAFYQYNDRARGPSYPPFHRHPLKLGNDDLGFRRRGQPVRQAAARVSLEETRFRILPLP